MRETSIGNDHSRISPTAKITAYWRSLSDIPYSQEIAEAVGAKGTAREMIGDRVVMMGSISPSMFEARYKSINRGLAKCGIANVMELACGLSPRGLEIASKGGVYVGTDLPEMYAESSPIIEAIARRTGVTLDNLHLQPVNVLDRSGMDNAASHFTGKRFAVCNDSHSCMTFVAMCSNPSPALRNEVVVPRYCDSRHPGCACDTRGRVQVDQEAARESENGYLEKS